MNWDKACFAVSSCWAYEGLIGLIKPFFLNTNNRNVSTSVFERIVMMELFTLDEQYRGSVESLPTRSSKGNEAGVYRLDPSSELCDDHGLPPHPHLQVVTGVVVDYRPVVPGRYISWNDEGELKVGMVENTIRESHEGQVYLVLKRPVGQQDVVTKNKSVEWLEFDEGFAERKFIVPLSSFVENLRVMMVRRGTMIVSEKT